MRERSERASTHTNDMLGHVWTLLPIRALPVPMLRQVLVDVYLILDDFYLILVGFH